MTSALIAFQPGGASSPSIDRSCLFSSLTQEYLVRLRLFIDLPAENIPNLTKVLLRVLAKSHERR